MIVVDTNVIAYLMLGGKYESHARSLLEEDPGWAVPTLWNSEFRNILAGYLRRGRLTLTEAILMHDSAQDLVSEGEYEIDSQSVLRLVQSSTCTAYDCEFVALAQSLGTKLVTMDGEILRAFPETAKPLVEA